MRNKIILALILVALFIFSIGAFVGDSNDSSAIRPKDSCQFERPMNEDCEYYSQQTYEDLLEGYS
tara:strand:- start:78 stop:272 length:195 start_codon:yes stop_codon:yes gene_type:complete